jgi:very-short-patch-repair endonuclease
MTSPIERLMLIGMYSVISQEEIGLFPLIKFEIISSDKPHPMQAARAAEHGTLVIRPQYRFLDWPADFVLSCPSVSKKIVVVECDGHDFHERTKEQAAKDRARDRAVQAQGHIMLRYTGSEIYRDPLGCARNALKTLATAIEPEWMDGLDLK